MTEDLEIDNVTMSLYSEEDDLEEEEEEEEEEECKQEIDEAEEKKLDNESLKAFKEELSSYFSSIM